MERKFAWLSSLLCVVLGLVGGCKKPETLVDYSRPLPPGAHALRKVTEPALLPDFAAGFTRDRQDLVQAVDHSLAYLACPSSREAYQKHYAVHGIAHEQAVEGLKLFRQIVLAARSPEHLAQQILENFDVYESVGCDNRGTVLFTGYYTPILEGSLVADSLYKYPLYNLPPDLVKDAEGRCLGRKMPDGSVAPYPTRRQIESGRLLAGQELVWLKDKFDAYVCHVQGSAKIKLPDGRLLEVGYAGKNAAPYASVGQALVEDGKIPLARRSLAAIRDYFCAHPDEIDKYCWRNESFIFFRQTSGGPFGSLGQPVTAYRTLATDKSIFPPGCLAFVATAVPVPRGPDLRPEPFSQFMLDQDSGGAIHAAGRADIYLGQGSQAGQIAGWTASEGRLYYLVPKPSAMPKPPAPLAAAPPLTQPAVPGP